MSDFVGYLLQKDPTSPAFISMSPGNFGCTNSCIISHEDHVVRNCTFAYITPGAHIDANISAPPPPLTTILHTLKDNYLETLRVSVVFVQGRQGVFNSAAKGMVVSEANTPCPLGSI
jgi:hypothetical protein